MKTVAERLTWARTVAEGVRPSGIPRLSQRELSQLAGLSSRHVCSLEGGALQGHMRADTAQALARVLGVRVSWLAYGEGRAPTLRAVVAAVAKAKALFAEQRKAS